MAEYQAGQAHFGARSSRIAPVAGTTTSLAHPGISECPRTVNLADWSAKRLAAAMIAVSVEVNQLQDVTPEVRGGVGGIVLMGNETSPSLRSQLISVGALTSHGVSLQPLVMTDEEGGGVQRLSAVVGSAPWPRDMVRTMSPGQVRSLARSIGARMKALGVGVDLAPVVDLDSGPGPSNSNPDGRRSFSSNASVATSYAGAFASGLREAGVVPVLKHFPGLGGSSGNTDVQSAQTLPISQLANSALVPFESLASREVMVMMSNASVPALTGGVPASLSRAAVALLRSTVGFKGTIITDSLETVSISNFQPNLGQAVVDSVRAGVDMVMLASSAPNQVAGFREARQAIVSAINEGSYPRASAETAVAGTISLHGFPRKCIRY